MNKNIVIAVLLVVVIGLGAYVFMEARKGQPVNNEINSLVFENNKIQVSPFSTPLPSSTGKPLLAVTPKPTQTPVAKPSPEISSRCGVRVAVQGTSFPVDSCELQMITGGPECTDESGKGVACAGTYAFEISSGRGSGVRIARLVNFTSIEQGKRYVFDPASPNKPFNGYFQDKAITYNLKSGWFEMEQGDLTSLADNATVSFDLTFANGVKMTGRGKVLITRVYEP